LQESGIPVPHHICVNRDNIPEGQDPEGFIETEDYVEVDGKFLLGFGMCIFHRRFHAIWLPSRATRRTKVAQSEASMASI